MQYFLNQLTSLTALLGPIATIVGLVQSRGWLAGIGAVVFCVSIVAIAYGRNQRLRVVAASVEIEGISIDSLNAANLRRRVNRSLFIQTADHFATVDGADLEMVWRYSGFCRADRETVMEFSVDSGNTIPFSKLDCYAYDLKRDPDKKYKIQPVFIGPDSIAKKLAIPFLAPLVAQQPFDIMLHSRLPNTYKPGIGYYTSTLSFDQDKVGRCTVHLSFLRRKPEWVRVYDCDRSGGPRLLKNLSPVRENQKLSEYRDVSENLKAQSARIYLFRRAGG
jgi:hypothetical protein